MTLTTHSIIAAVVTKPLLHTHPILIFAAAILSHYLSDAIPHWDYQLESLSDEENADKRAWSKDWHVLGRDILHFAFDGFLGAAIVLLIARPVSREDWVWIIFSVIGGCLPDFLQGLYVLKLRLLKSHQRLHDFMHAKIRLGPYPLIGIPFQLAISLLSLYFLV